MHFRFATTIAMLGALCFAPVKARASAPPQVVRVDDLDYVHRTYYFIADHPIKIKDGTLYVYKDDRIQQTNVYESVGIARVDPLADSSATNPQLRGNFSLLEPDQDYFIQYLWVNGYPEVMPILRLREPLGSVQLLAVSYVEERNGGEVRVGTGPMEFGPPDSALGKPANSLLIKLIGMETTRAIVDPATSLFDPADPIYPVLSYELRNLYDLGLRQIPKERFYLKVKKIDNGAPDDPEVINDTPISMILGLDQKSPSGESMPDGIIDDEFIDYDKGLIFFPDLHPFAPDTSEAGCPPGWGGFLCLDDLVRNTLRGSMTNRHVYYGLYPDPVADTRYYIESTIVPVPEPGGVLRQNRPNPFNPDTRIEFELTLEGHARVSVYDVRGRLVSELLDQDMTWGPHSVFWNGRSGTNPVASGVYYYVLETGGHTYTKRMVLAR